MTNRITPLRQEIAAHQQRMDDYLWHNASNIDSASVRDTVAAMDRQLTYLLSEQERGAVWYPKF
jgi:3-phenylpropionate/cinnamic acid dioxygenase small subunit